MVRNKLALSAVKAKTKLSFTNRMYILKSVN
jgi:hypothetical protein